MLFKIQGSNASKEISEKNPEISDYIDYRAITPITKTLKNKEKSV
jgi:hypothetical protein